MLDFVHQYYVIDVMHDVTAILKDNQIVLDQLGWRANFGLNDVQVSLQVSSAISGSL